MVDLTDCLLQPQVLASAFQQLMADQRTRSRRMAFVFGASPARMQVRRILAQRDDIGLFVTETEAMAWLTGRTQMVA